MASQVYVLGGAVAGDRSLSKSIHTLMGEEFELKFLSSSWLASSISFGSKFGESDFD